MARFNGGWFAVPRELVRKYDADPLCLLVMIKLVSWALVRENWADIGGRLTLLQKYQLLLSERSLGKQTGLDRSTIRRKLEKLCINQEIAPHKTPHGTVITILNPERFFYDDTPESTTNQPTTSPPPAQDQPYIEQSTKKTKKQEYIYPPIFESLYLEYPKRGGKAEGYVRYQRDVKTPEMHERVLQAIRRYKKICADEQREAKHIKSFEVFMNQWRNFDEEDAGTLVLPKKTRADEQARLMALLD